MPPPKMTRCLVSILTILIMCLVTACGGGGDNGSDDLPMPDVPVTQPEAELEPEPELEPELEMELEPEVEPELEPDLEPEPEMEPEAMLNPFPLPFGYRVEAGEYVIASGRSEVIGDIAVLCEQGGGDCTIVMAADGTATYAASGGNPVIFAYKSSDPTRRDQAYFPLSGPYYPTHALTRNAVSDHDDATQIPDTVHVGPLISIPQSDSFSTVAEHEGISIRHGPRQDGVGADALISYLAHDARLEGMIKRFGDTPPTVRVVEGATPMMIGDAAEVVKAINSALPIGWQLRFSGDPALSIAEPVEGEILIAFQDGNDTSLLPSGQEGIAFTRTGLTATGNPEQPYIHPITAGRVLVRRSLWDNIPALGRLTLAHELLHTMGREHPHIQTDLFNQTVMGNPVVAPGLKSGRFLAPLDREALAAVYGVLEVGQPTSELIKTLSDWSDTSAHLLGRFDVHDEQVVFGVASRNGFTEPYVQGPKPWVPVTGSAALSGTVTWDGRLTGFTPGAEPVIGGARLGVDLSTREGDLAFSNLEYWTSGTTPGAPGSGAQWGDGSLSYDIRVRFNYFTQTGGDEGVVTGAFLGPLHEGMGGVLERSDLTAAFGGKR